MRISYRFRFMLVVVVLVYRTLLEHILQEVVHLLLIYTTIFDPIEQCLNPINKIKLQKGLTAAWGYC